jgi:hypothetical protein
MVSCLMVRIRKGAVNHAPKQAATMKMLPGAETLPVKILGKSESGHLTTLHDRSL